MKAPKPTARQAASAGAETARSAANVAVPTDRVILSSMVVTFGSTVAATMLPKDVGGKGELPSPRLLIGTSLTFMGLSLLGDFAPGLAKPLSAAIAVTALTYYGIPVLDAWFNQHHTTPITPATTPTPTNVKTPLPRKHR